MPRHSQLPVLLICFAWIALLSLSAKGTEKETLVYKTVGERELRIHISKPVGWDQENSRPAVVFFHGGGWTGGKPGQFDDHCKYLVDRGMVCFQVEYRLLGKSKKPVGSGADADDSTPKKCIEDAKSAIRWVRHRASELGIDPDRIASGGGSAGGHLAAFLGTTDGTDDVGDNTKVSARANAMLLFNPVYNNGPNANGLKGWGTARVGDRYGEFSPAHNISEDDAPSIVFLGTSDNLVSVGIAQEFQNQMLTQGVRSDLRLYAGAGHGFFNSKNDDGKWFRLTIEETDEFLVSLGWLKQKDAGQ